MSARHLDLRKLDGVSRHVRASADGRKWLDERRNTEQCHLPLISLQVLSSGAESPSAAGAGLTAKRP